MVSGERGWTDDKNRGGERGDKSKGEGVEGSKKEERTVQVYILIITNLGTCIQTLPLKIVVLSMDVSTTIKTIKHLKTLNVYRYNL